MEQVTAYRATDGELFSDPVTCQEYEASLAWKGKIAEFTSSGRNPYPTGAHASMCSRIIVAWETFKANSKDEDLEQSQG